MFLSPIVNKIRRKLDKITARINPNGRYILYDNANEISSDKILIYVVHLTVGEPPSVILDNISLYEEFGFDIIIVITFSDHSLESVIELSKRLFNNKRFIVRKNYGKDFGGFSDAISIIPKEFCGKLVFQNDSLVGPLYSSDFLKKFITTESQFGGVTESFFPKYHLQSSHLIFSDRGLKLLREFFSNHYPIYNYRANIINLGEINLTQFMIRNGVATDPFFKHFELLKLASRTESVKPGFPLSKVNPQHFFADIMFSELEYPYIKREVLTINQTNHPFSWERILKRLDFNQLSKLSSSIASRI